MNKTININLAGCFFHIDEDAYQKLQHYLSAVKASFVNTPGADEINADIEARIAELFDERLSSNRQVVGMKEVDEVIAIMGQPEDYMVDEELFEDEDTSQESTQKKGKKLYRDTDNSYISGVSSGLGHYLGIDAIWVRLIWLLLSLGSSGAFILIYLAFWIFVPEARTTAEKLEMRGEPINISNIERKIKEGFDDVSDRVKDVDYKKYGYKVRKHAQSATSELSKAIGVILNICVKIIGVLILLVAGFTLIGLFIGAVTFGFFGLSEAMWSELMLDAPMDSNLIWISTILALIVIGIPFVFLFILGIKILMPYAKSTGRTPNLVLLGVWIIALLGLIFIGVKQATATAFKGEVVLRQDLPLTQSDTLYISMQGNDHFETDPYRNGDISIFNDENLGELYYKDKVRFLIRPSRESTARMEIHKLSAGHSSSDARQRAEAISYYINLKGNELFLDGFLTTPVAQKIRNQEVLVHLYLPQGMVINASRNTQSFHRNHARDRDILQNGDEERYLLITSSDTQCLDCEEAVDQDPEQSEELDIIESTERLNQNDTLEDSSNNATDLEDPWSEPYTSKSKDSL